MEARLAIFPILAIIGLVLIGGLVLTIALLANPKTRAAGVALLAIGLVVVLGGGVMMALWWGLRAEPVARPATAMQAEARRMQTEAMRMQREAQRQAEEAHQRLRSQHFAPPTIPAPMPSTPIPPLDMVPPAEAQPAPVPAPAPPEPPKAPGATHETVPEKAPPAEKPPAEAEKPSAATDEVGERPSEPPADAEPSPVAVVKSGPEAEKPAAEAEKPVAEVEKPAAEAEKPGPDAATPPPPAEIATPAPLPAADPRPAWVASGARKVGDNYQICITVGPFTNRLECDAQLPAELEKALSAYMDVYLDRESARLVRLPDSELRRLVQDQWEEHYQASFGPMVNLHVLLQFDRRLNDRIKEERKNAIVAHRLWFTGTGLVSGFCLLGIVFVCLKVDHGTRGAYRKRLGAAGILVAAAVALALLVAVRIGEAPAAPRAPPPGTAPSSTDPPRYSMVPPIPVESVVGEEHAQGETKQVLVDYGNGLSQYLPADRVRMVRTQPDRANTGMHGWKAVGLLTLTVMGLGLVIVHGRVRKAGLLLLLVTAVVAVFVGAGVW